MTAERPSPTGRPLTAYVNPPADVGTADVRLDVYAFNLSDLGEAPETVTTLESDDVIAISTIQGYAAETGTTASNLLLWFDADDLSSAEAITGVDATLDTVTVAGDRQAEFRAGRTFDIANSTGNDGSYTSAGATYDASEDETIVETVEDLTDATVDGDVTSDAVVFEDQIVWRQMNNVDSGAPPTFFPDNHEFLGMPGYSLWISSDRTVVSSIIVTGRLRKRVRKTAPVSQQSGQTPQY